MIAATVLGSSMAAIDATVIGIALPTIGRDFHASLERSRGWSPDTPSPLPRSCCSVDPSGPLRAERVFMIGVASFALASAACAVSTGSGQLIVTASSRAWAVPCSPRGASPFWRPRSSPMTAMRPSGLVRIGRRRHSGRTFLGGYLIVAASWRWIFLIDIPIGVAVLILSGRHVPESRDPSATGRVDGVGAALVTVSLGTITYALIGDPNTGGRHRRSSWPSSSGCAVRLPSPWSSTGRRRRCCR